MSVSFSAAGALRQVIHAVLSGQLSQSGSGLCSPMACPPFGEDGTEIGNIIEALVSGTRCTYTAMASLAIRPIRALSCCAMHDAAAGKVAEEQASNLVPMVTFLTGDSYYDQASSNMIVGSSRCVCKDLYVRQSTVRGAKG